MTPAEGATTTQVPAGRAALAGGMAAAVALAVTELAAGAVTGIPSAVSSVGSFVVDWSPPAVARFAISAFGTGDKAALAVGTVVIVLVIGAVAGRAGARRFPAAVPWFAGFAALGVLAGLAQPLTSPAPTIATGVAAAAAGLAVLRLLLDAARPLTDPARLAAADPARRRFLIIAAATGAAALTGAALGRRMLVGSAQTVLEAGALPAPARPVTPPGPAASFPVDGLTPIVVPNPDFYRIDTALVVPRIDPDNWTLSITGMVDTPLQLTLADLTALPLVEDYITISCVSNRVGGDLVGNARWTGVRLVELLERAGVQQGATQLVGRSVDGFTAGFPTELCFDGRDPLVALGMNGEPLPADHGYPARLIVPGLYGYVSATKWLDEIELTTWEAFDGYWIPRGWSKEGPIKLQSRIDVPSDGADLPTGDVVVAGVAWAPTRKISRVEVALDRSDEWVPAELSEPLSDNAWVQWRATLALTGGRHTIEVRAADGSGVLQTDEVQPARPDGATGYHRIRVNAG